MDPDLKKAADARFDEARAETGARDPRDYYRQRLKELRSANPDKYAEAVQYYEDQLVPSIAEGGADPLRAWTDFGARLAGLAAPGQAWAVDGTGGRRPHEPPVDLADVVLHVPTGRERVFVVWLPSALTPAQQATVDWLVAGRRALREGERRKRGAPPNG